MLFVTIAAFAVVAQLTSALTQLPINPYTCGYYSGESNSPVTCSSPNACISFPSPTSLPNFGCCAGSDVCFVSTCLDYGVASNTGTASEDVAINNGPFLCPSDTPYCTTVILYGESIVDGTRPSYLSYGCSTISGVTSIAYQGTSPASAAASPTTSTSTSPTTIRQPSPTKSSSTSGGLSTGTDVGIGVGVGVGALLVIIAIAAWAWRGRRSRASRGDRPHPGYEQYAQRDPYPSHEEPKYQDSTVWGKSELGGTSYAELASDRSIHELAARGPR